MSRNSLAHSALALLAFASALSGQMPAAPTISAVHAGDTALTVVWTNPSGVTGITNYDVRYILTSADETVDANWTLKENVWTDGDQLLYIIAGLSNDVSYDVQVRVKTDTNGAWSSTTEGEAEDRPPTICPAQATIPINVPLGGNLSTYFDRDRYSFQVTTAARFTIGSQGSLDLVGTLYKMDPTWSEVARNDDSGPDRNFRIVRPLSAGLYCLEIRGLLGHQGDFTFELESRADSTGRSDAHQVALDGNGKGVLDAPDDEDYFQFTLAAETDVLIFADPAEWDMKAELQDSNGTFLATSDDGYVIFRETQFFFRRNLAADTYYVKVEAPGRSSGEYSVHVQTATTPGTGIAGAATVSLSTAGAQYSGRIASATDADYFKIQTSSAANLYVRAVSNTVDIDGAIVNGNDQAVSANVFEQDFTSSGPKGFTISARLDAGTHYVKVTRSSSDSATGGFLLWVVKDDTMDNITRTCSRNTPFSDPFIICQWFLRNSGQFVDSTFGEDIRVQDVWNSGVLGAGVGVAVVDDGFHIGHPDLAANVDATRNHDYVGNGLFYPLGEHGTSIAGIIAARDDSIGMRGVAPRATIFGNNLLLSGDVANEADALTRNAATTGVSNNSWSFRDSPAVDAATAAWELAIETGLETGYGGKGTVYVWAGGNGGPDDHTNIDGRTNHYGVIAVCATTDQGVQSNYSESGASLWVCGPSSGQDRNTLLSDRPGIYTTRNYGRYGEFTGTSAATPTVAGVVALMRSANSNLTWRDVKLILAATARKNDSSDGSWNTGVGKLGASGNYHFSHRYGFGVVNASAAVTLAQTWTLLPPLIRTTPVTETANLAIPDGIQSGPSRPWGATVTSSLEVGDDVDFIEFVEIVADFDTDEFRDLEVTLTSPSGTVSTISTRTYLLAKFRYDLSIDPDYRFGSAKHLGENPEGAWTLTMRDGWSGDTATLNSWSVRIYGHRARPNSPTGASVVGGQKSLAVSWSEPTVVGASEIISYDLRYIRTDAADKADGHWTVQTGVWSSGGLEYTLMGLLDMTEYDVQLRAMNSRGFGPWSETAVGLTLPNRAPGESLSPLFLQVENGAQSVDVSSAFTDPTNLTFTAASSDATVATVAVTGSMVTVTPVLHGTTTVTVTGTGGGGSSTTQTFTVTVANRPPQAAGTLPALSLRAEDGAGTVDVSGAFTDPDNDALTFTAASSDETVATVAVANSVVTVTPRSGGATTVTVTATDGSGSSATQEFDATVANRSPAAAGTLAALSLRAEDGDRTVDVSGAFTDPDNDDLTYVATSSDETVATVAVADSVVTVTPLSRGTTTVTVTATDVENGSATQTFEVTVANRPPELVGRLAALSLRVEDGDETVDVSGAFTDPDNDDLTFAARSSNETAATVAVSDSVVTVTPLSGGTTRVTVTATDEENRSATQEFEVTVVNRPPLPADPLADAALQVGEGAEVVEVADAFEDPDQDTLTYGASSSAPGVAGAAVSGSRVTLTPLAHGTATITVTATDVTGSNTQASQRFDVRVKARRGVTVSTAALTVTEGSTETYTVVLDSEPTGDVVVTATVPANTDVTVDPPALTFTIEDWQTPQTVAVEAAEDQDSSADPAVTITHQVSGNDYGSVSASSVRVTIVETGTSTLSVTAAGASESSSSIFFEVTLSRPSTSEITVDYLTSNGPGSGGARAGSDYTAARGTLTFAANSTASQEIVVAITDDTEDEEEEETFRLTLRNPQNAELAGGESTLQVSGTIEDDDDPEVEVSFGSSSYGVAEGRTVDVVVRLNRDPERDLEIFLEETLHGGAADADYSGVPLSVAFGPGVRRQQFQVAATDDTADDDGEAVVLSFVSLPPRVSDGGETTIAISDNDGSGGGGGGPPAGGGGGGGVPPPGGDDPPPGDDDDGGGVQPPPPPAPGGPPKADFTLTAECAGDLCRARTGLPVTFEDTSTGRVQSRRWDFGDGTGSRNRRIDHVWAEPGFYEVSLTVSDGTTESIASEVFLVEAGDPAGTCESSAERRCLQDSRYAVTVEWLKPDGESGSGSVVHAGTNDSGLFTFFNAENWEVLIKVLDGCALNGHVWVYGASTTDLGYVIRVTDTTTGTVKEYRNEPGMPAPAITDATAFPEGCRQ